MPYAKKETKEFLQEMLLTAMTDIFVACCDDAYKTQKLKFFDSIVYDLSFR